jgi:NDP-sugar pyrophosphorylase family protein
LPPALILTGGKQVRFPHLTASELPKAMLPINGVPLLEHTIRRLHDFGILDITLSVGPGGQKIKDYFRDGRKLDVSIRYLEQTISPAGTASALKQAAKQFPAKPFFLLYGDVLTTINYLDLLQFHTLHKNTTCTMMLTSVEHVQPWGLARLAGSRIIDFQEKPKNPTIKSHLVNAGVYVMEPMVFKYIGSNDTKLETSVLPRLAEESRLGGYVFEGPWYDVSTEETYREVLQFAKNQ